MHFDPGVLLALGIARLGAVVGIGGGNLLVPALVVGFGLDMRIAVATSLDAVVATSTAAGSVHVGSGVTNTRLAMSLAAATTLGGLIHCRRPRTCSRGVRREGIVAAR